MYRTKRCRCIYCRAANAEYQYKLRVRRAERLRAGEVDPPHGVESTYSNYMCRCEDCLEAHVEANYRNYQRSRYS